MDYASLRRVRVPWLDRQVSRAAMQICHQVVMHQLYVSRIDVHKQHLVISNPSPHSIDLSDYCIANGDSKGIFHFPKGYVLSEGADVTVWCAPAAVDIDADILIQQPYLFWTRPDGSYSTAPFFLKNRSNEVVLLDPFMVEVASLRVAASGKHDYRVLDFVSEHAKPSVASLLAPKKFEKQFSCRVGGMTPVAASYSNRGVYVFSRYWGVVSDRSVVAHYVALLLEPLIETIRAVLLCSLLLLVAQEQPFELSPFGSDASTFTLLHIALIYVCDVAARRLTLCIRSGQLVRIMSLVSLILDQLLVVAMYRSLSRVYPHLDWLCDRLQMAEVVTSFVCMAAIQLDFVALREQWHPAFQLLTRIEFFFETSLCWCSLGRELALWLLQFVSLGDGDNDLCRVDAFWWRPLAFGFMLTFTLTIGIQVIYVSAAAIHLLVTTFSFTRGGTIRQL